MKQFFAYISALFLLLNFEANAQNIVISAPVLGDHFDAEGKGRSQAVLKAIYNHCNINLDIRPNKWSQHWRAYEQDKSIDAAAIVWENAFLKGFTSDPYIFSKIGVVSLKSRKLKIDTITDLKDLRVTAFVGASDRFPDLIRNYKIFKSYIEAPGGNMDYKKLMVDTTDVFVTDPFIFLHDYFAQIKAGGGQYGDPFWPTFTFHNILPDYGDSLIFKSKEKRDQFNACLKSATEAGITDKALKPYYNKYEFILRK